MNRDRLTRIAGYFFANPARLNMNFWHSWTDTVPYVTVRGAFLQEVDVYRERFWSHSIAGIAEILYREEADVLGFPTTNAERILQLTREQGTRLFYLLSSGGLGWPDAFRAQYLDAKTDEGRARVVIDRISVFMQSDGEV
jgi:hypothetical protein